MSVSLTSPDLVRFGDDLDAAAAHALAECTKLVSKGALNIKTDARRLAPHGVHTPHYPNSISYDIKHGTNWVEAEVGPDKDRRQGALGNLLEYGSVNNPPHPHLTPAGDLEEPRFYRAAEQLAEDLVERRR